MSWVEFAASKQKKRFLLIALAIYLDKGIEAEKVRASGGKKSLLYTLKTYASSDRAHDFLRSMKAIFLESF